jgi:hypothetical protein
MMRAPGVAAWQTSNRRKCATDRRKNTPWAEWQNQARAKKKRKKGRTKVKLEINPQESRDP